MKIAIGADHGGYELKESLKHVLKQRGIAIEDVGCYNAEAVDYPDFAHAVAAMVSEGLAAQGVLICRTGLGMSMGEALDMTTADRDWFIERIGDQRSREAKEIERASKKR